jgi:hypothetical protein
MRRFAGWVITTRLLPRNHARAHLSLSEYGSFPCMWTAVSSHASVRVFHLRNQFIHKIGMRDGTKMYRVYLLYCAKVRMNIYKDSIHVSVIFLGNSCCLNSIKSVKLT